MVKKQCLLAVDHDDTTKSLPTQVNCWASEGEDSVTVLGVAPRLSQTMRTSKVSSMARDAEERLVTDLRHRLNQLRADVPCTENLTMVSGSPADEIIKEAVLLKADLVVKPADRPAGEKAPLFGSVEKKLIRKCPVPVWITRPERGDAPKRIAVAVPNTEHDDLPMEAALQATNLLKHAAELARRFGLTEIDVIHAWNAEGIHFLESPRADLPPADIQRYINEWEDVSSAWLKRFIEEMQPFVGEGIALRPHLVRGEARRVVPKALSSLSTDVLIIGSANRTGLPGLFLGNTAESIIDQTECDVYVVKPAGFGAVMSA